AVRPRIAAFHLHVDGAHARLDVGFDGAAHLRAQPAIVRVLEAHGRCLVHAHLHAAYADFRLAGLRAKRVARREPVADLCVGPTALQTALQLDLPGTRDDDG